MWPTGSSRASRSPTARCRPGTASARGSCRGRGAGRGRLAPAPPAGARAAASMPAAGTRPALAGIDVAEQHQVGEQHPASCRRSGASRRSQSSSSAAARQQVGDVAAVEALALHDERLRPDHLLGRAEPDRHPEHLVLDRVLEPAVVHPRDAVARAEDHVDEVLAVAGLAQPVGEGALGAVALACERRRARGRSPAGGRRRRSPWCAARCRCSGRRRRRRRPGTARRPRCRTCHRLAVERRRVSGSSGWARELRCQVVSLMAEQAESKRRTRRSSASGMARGLPEPGGSAKGGTTMDREERRSGPDRRGGRLHYTQEPAAAALAAGAVRARSGRECDVLLLRRRPDRPRPARGGPGAGARDPRLGEHPGRRRPRQPRLRVGQAGGGQADPRRRGVKCWTATPSRSRASASPGIKGFCGGFGKRALGPWGEDIIKRFVHEAVDEALKLESALARLRAPSRDRRAPLLADPGDGRGGAARDLPLPRLAAGWRSRSTATGSTPSSTATPTAAGPRGRRRPACRSTTSAIQLLQPAFPDRPAFQLFERPGPGGAAGRRLNGVPGRPLTGPAGRRGAPVVKLAGRLPGAYPP